MLDLVFLFQNLQIIKFVMYVHNTSGFVTRRNVGEGNKYAAYVAETAPQGGVFSLNIDCSRQILVSNFLSSV